jgi:hypothetical protein
MRWLIVLALPMSWANAASPLRIACIDEQPIAGRALVCEYSLLGRQNEKLALLHERIVDTDKGAQVDMPRWIEERDACVDVPCLDQFFEARLAQAAAVIASPAPQAVAPPPPIVPEPKVVQVPPPALPPPQAAPVVAELEMPPAEVVPVAEEAKAETPIVAVAVKKTAVKAWPRRGIAWLLGSDEDEAPANESAGLEPELLAGAAVIVTLCLVLLIMLRGSLTRCPKCEKWFAEEEGERDTVSRWTDYRTLPGRETSVPVPMRMDEVAYRCRHCAHEWRTREARRA